MDLTLSAETEAAEAKLGAYLVEIGLPEEEAEHISELVAEIAQSVSDTAFVSGLRVGVQSAKEAAREALGIEEAAL